MRTVAILIAILIVLPFGAIAATPPPAPSDTASRICGLEAKAKAVWIELSANLPTLTDTAKLALTLDNIKQAGFNAIVIDVKNAAGFTAYPSQLAPHISQSTAERKGLFTPYPAPKTWLAPNLDILKNVVSLSHDRKIAVCASINIFSEGINLWKDGAAYQGLNPAWLSLEYTASRNIVAPDKSELEITAVNIGRTNFGVATGRIMDNAVLYTIDPPAIAQKVNGWALDGMEVIVTSDKNENLFVKEMIEWSTLAGKPYHLRIPGGGFILSVHGSARQWALTHLKQGNQIFLSKLKKLLNKSTDNGIFAFTDPLNPDVRQRALAIIREVITNYQIDGVVLDRIRYDGAASDFSDTTRHAFECYLFGCDDKGKPQRKISHWPESVLDYGAIPSWYVQIPGKYFAPWATFRAFVIQSFIKEAIAVVKSANPKVSLSIYVGGWYPAYYEEATNWGSQTTQPNYWWTTRDWPNTGVAELVDSMFIGLYYRNLTIKEARSRPISDPDWASLEGGIPLIKYVTQNKAVLIGSINITDYEERPDEIPHALAAIMAGVDHVMVFDLIYIDAFNLWPEITKAFNKP